jgi:DMSO/TMAO reductase YedYZ heme-binding membrane subunit
MWTSLGDDPQDVLKAAVALVLLIVATGISARQARRRVRYETWHFVHLCTYLTSALGFLHQVSVGRDFASSLAARTFWWALHALALPALLVSVFWCRFDEAWLRGALRSPPPRSTNRRLLLPVTTVPSLGS